MDGVLMLESEFMVDYPSVYYIEECIDANNYPDTKITAQRAYDEITIIYAHIRHLSGMLATCRDERDWLQTQLNRREPI